MTAPQPIDSTAHDDLIVQTDNSGERGQQAENQDPHHVPDGSIQ